MAGRRGGRHRSGRPRAVGITRPVVAPRRCRRRRRWLRGLPGRRQPRGSCVPHRSGRARPHALHRGLHRYPQRRDAEPAGDPDAIADDGQPPARRRRVRVPELRPDVPHRHVDDDAGDLRLRRRQRVHAPGRCRGALSRHRGGALHRRVHHAAHHRADPRGQRRRPLRPHEPAIVRRQAGVERHDHRGRLALDDPSGRLRPDRGHRHAHVQRPRRRLCGELRTALAGRGRAHRRSRRQRGATRRDGRDRGPRPAGHDRAIATGRTRRRDARPEAGTTPATSAAASRTGRSASSGRRGGS